MLILFKVTQAGPEPSRTPAWTPTMWTCDLQTCGVVGESVMCCAAEVCRLGPLAGPCWELNSVACVERARRGPVVYLRRLPVKFAFWTVISALSKEARRVQMI